MLENVTIKYENISMLLIFIACDRMQMWLHHAIGAHVEFVGCS